MPHWAHNIIVCPWQLFSVSALFFAQVALRWPCSYRDLRGDVNKLKHRPCGQTGSAYDGISLMELHCSSVFHQVVDNDACCARGDGSSPILRLAKLQQWQYDSYRVFIENTNLSKFEAHYDWLPGLKRQRCRVHHIFNFHCARLFRSPLSAT